MKKNILNINNKKNLVIGIVILVIVLIFFISFQGKTITQENNLSKFNQCLSDNGVVIYGSKFCSACKNLVETLGGYESTKPVYVECTEEQKRCQREAKTGYVPEIQINGEIYEGSRSLDDLGKITGCEVPN